MTGGGGGEGGRAASRASVAVFLAAAALLALAAVLAFAGAGGAARALAGALALAAGGVAIGPLVAITPVEPSPLKLGAFSSTLGLALGGAVVLLARGAAGGGEAAGAWGLALGSAGALAAAARRLHLAPPGRAAACAMALALGAGAAVWLALASPAGLTLRASSPGAVVHATLAAEWLRAGPGPGQPWLAGADASVRVGPSLAVAFVAAASGLGPLRAGALLCALSVLLLGLVAYLTAAAAGRGAPRRLAGARDLCATVASVSVAGAAVRPDGIGEPGVMLALAFAAAAALAALHAARSAVRPWPALAVSLTAAASLAAPVAGVAAAAVGAAVASRHGRTLLAGASALACAPGILEARSLGAAGVLPGAGLGAADGRLALAIGALVAVPALFALAHARFGPCADASDPRRRTGPPRAASIAAVACGALIALAPAALLGAQLRERAAALQGLAPALAEDGGRLDLAQSSERLRALRGAFAAIRASGLPGGPRGAALLRWSDGAEPVAGAPPSLTPLLTGLPLWWDRAPPPGLGEAVTTAQGERRSDRGDVARALLGHRAAWRARHARLLAGSVARRGPLVAVVTDADRRRTAPRADVLDAPDIVLQRLGADVLHEAEGVTVYVLGS